MVYSGIIAGSYYVHPSGVNYLCLPKEPEHLSSKYSLYGKKRSYLYGTEYEETIFSTVSYSENAPCAVCYTSTKSVQIMIPAKTTCPDTWTTEYNGYLMTQYYKQYGSKDYICVDKEADAIPDSGDNTDGALLYNVASPCSKYLPCPPYNHDMAITCVVCTK